MTLRPSRNELRRPEVATWGDRPAAAPRCLRLVSWRPLAKRSLRGFATVELPIGLKIVDCLVSNGKAWASLPSKPQIDQDGCQKTDTNGKVVYTPILDWRDRGLADRFSVAVIELVRSEYPAALDGSGAP